MCIKFYRVTTYATESPFSIKPITENSGILSLKTADLFISRTTWKLISTLELEPHLERGNTLTNSILLIQKKCGNNCEFKEEIQILLDRLIENQQYLTTILDSLKPTNEKRTKRAVLDTIGKIYKLLYGTLIEEDEIFLIQKLQNCLNDTAQLASLIKHQTEIIQLNNLLITQKFTDTDRMLKNIFENQQEQNQKKVIERAYHSVMEATFQFEMDSKILIDAIFIAAEGKFHPKIIQEKLFWDSKKNTFGIKNEISISKQNSFYIRNFNLIKNNYSIYK